MKSETNIEWSDYRYFLAIARAGSLSGAARDLNVSQPTVGRRIKELEAQLAVRLFDRAVDGFALTPEGASVLELAERIERATFEIERRAAGKDASLAGRVCIATTECLAVSWLTRQLPELQRRYSDIELHLLVDVKTADLGRREADLALRIGCPGSEELVGRPVCKVTFGLYAAESYLCEYGEPQHLDELRHHVIIESLEELAELPQSLELRARAEGASVGLRCNGMMNQVAAARAGLGIVALPHYAAVRSSELRRVLAGDFELERDLWLLMHKDLRDTARMKVVREFLRDAIDRDAPVFTGKPIPIRVPAPPARCVPHRVPKAPMAVAARASSGQRVWNSP